MRIIAIFNKFWNDYKLLMKERQVTKKVYKHRDEIILSDFSRKTQNNSVNIHYWRTKENQDNLGDFLSKIVVEYYAANLISNRDCSSVKGIRHIYAIGSILGFGCQRAVVWGSGLLMPYRLYFERLLLAKPDVRCVRGPKTRDELLKLGISCPEIYGDPAILMPEIYQPDCSKKEYDILLITHFSQNNIIDGKMHRIDMLTQDYKFVIDEIVKSKKIISSSLHGIILAEVYNIPAVLWLPCGSSKFKYEDYYLSTGRSDIIIAESLEEALRITPMTPPHCFEEMRKKLKATFPVDLWNK